MKSSSQIISSETEFADMHLIEAMRGCPWKCRFCAVSAIYSPVRYRDLPSITAEINNAKTLAKRIGIVGASLTDYPYIADVLCMQNVEYSITSLRASRKTSQLIELMKNKSSISIAPETGSDRLRKVINKGITKKDIIETSKLILKDYKGTLRLYLMLGLPTETDDDIGETAELVADICRLSKTANKIVLSISTFVPKAFTVFQWHSMTDSETIKRRLKLIKDTLKKERVKIFSDLHKYALMQGLFSLGNRNVSKIIEAMTNIPDWKEACKTQNIDYTLFVFRNKTLDETMPWDFIQYPKDKAKMWEEYKKAIS
ncbi:Fe-S oxidoreductase [Candidatus Magnetoovum chiemensis]|nr:Fe-S oxidoreductase [Candidatus Magnetoovum chiemensis]